MTNCFYMLPLQDVRDMLVCAICLDYISLSPHSVSLYQDSKARDIDVHYLEAHPETLQYQQGEEEEEEKGGVNILHENQKIPWITPCGHVFHAGCLRNWLEQSLQCPIDREQIPLPNY